MPARMSTHIPTHDILSYKFHAIRSQADSFAFVDKMSVLLQRMAEKNWVKTNHTHKIIQS